MSQLQMAAPDQAQEQLRSQLFEEWLQMASSSFQKQKQQHDTVENTNDLDVQTMPLDLSFGSRAMIEATNEQNTAPNQSFPAFSVPSSPFYHQTPFSSSPSIPSFQNQLNPTATAKGQLENNDWQTLPNSLLYQLSQSNPCGVSGGCSPSAIAGVNRDSPQHLNFPSTIRFPPLLFPFAVPPSSAVPPSISAATSNSRKSSAGCSISPLTPATIVVKTPPGYCSPLNINSNFIKRDSSASSSPSTVNQLREHHPFTSFYRSPYFSPENSPSFPSSNHHPNQKSKKKSNMPKPTVQTRANCLIQNNLRHRTNNNNNLRRKKPKKMPDSSTCSPITRGPYSIGSSFHVRRQLAAMLNNRN